MYSNKEIFQDDFLNKFQKSSLSSLESYQLINRHDTKYIFSSDLFPVIINQLYDNYNILEINNYIVFHYNNLYFDTNDFYFYYSHHNGKLNRYKIRYRQYNETKICYFEIKNKTNKSKTLKERILQTGIHNSIEGDAQKLIDDTIKDNSLILEPSLWVEYSRITLLNKNLPEKLTIDTNLYYRNSNLELSLPGIVIAEVKQRQISDKSHFMQIMRNQSIIEMNMSKYCVGTILTNPGIKYNRFKPKLLMIQKLWKNNYGKLKFSSI